MRTKTIILSAACGLAAAAAANADSVYSVNVVGYVNASYTANTFKMITSPLNTTNNTLREVFASLTEDDYGTMLYVWNASASKYTFYSYNGVDDGWQNFNTGADANAVVFAPGQGAWINFVNGDKTVTFVGDVSQGTLTQQIYTGYNQLASSVPQASDIVTLGLTNSTDGDVVYKRTSDAKHPWKTWTYLDGDWSLDSTGASDIPTLDVGEAVWYIAQAPTTWIRTFNVQ